MSAPSRASHWRTACVARCSLATSHRPERHRSPISRIPGSATSMMARSTPTISVATSSARRTPSGSSTPALSVKRSRYSLRRSPAAAPERTIATASRVGCPRVISSRTARNVLSHRACTPVLPSVRAGDGKPYLRSHDLIVGTGIPRSSRRRLGVNRNLRLASRRCEPACLREISNNKRSGTYTRRKVKPVVLFSNPLRLHPVMRRQNVAVILNRKCEVAME